MTFTAEEVRKYGYVTVPKCIQKAPWYGTKAETVWLFLRMNARYQAGIISGIELAEGEWLGSVQQICEQTNLTPKAVRYAVEQLKKDGELSTRTENSKAGLRTVFTLCTWACITAKKQGQAGLPLAKQVATRVTEHKGDAEGQKARHLGQTAFYNQSKKIPRV